MKHLMVDYGRSEPGRWAEGRRHGQRSDFSRYANSRWAFVLGTCSVQWLVGIFVAPGGFVTTAACQIVYGKIYWNPPDLMMVMMDSKSGRS